MTFTQRLCRILCWLRGYHVYGAAGINMFKYHIAGDCSDCGPARLPRDMTAFDALMERLQAWRNADHEDSTLLSRNAIIEIIEGVKALRT